MQTRNCDYFDTKTMTPMYGVEVKHDGQWKRVARDGTPAIFDSEAERDALRAELRKRKTEQ